MEEETRKELNTWGGRSTFSYEGSVKDGTVITFGRRGTTVTVTTEEYAALREHFRNRLVPAGTSRNAPQRDSLGAWLCDNVTRVAIASYVAPILVEEGYAERDPVDGSKIRVIK